MLGNTKCVAKRERVGTELLAEKVISFNLSGEIEK